MGTSDQIINEEDGEYHIDNECKLDDINGRQLKQGIEHYEDENYHSSSGGSGEIRM